MREWWIGEDVERFSFLAEPIADKLGGGAPSASADPMAAIFSQLGPALVGMQMGSLAGVLSQRVLGQFDVGLPLDGPVTFVGSNVESFASDHGLDVRQVRLWAAIHEVVHRAEFALPWVQDHIDDLFDDFAAEIQIDPAALQNRLGDLQNPEQIQQMMEDPAGMTGLLAGPGQAAVLARIQAFMAVTEGYAEWLVERAAPGMVPQANRIRDAVDERRADASEGETLIQRVLGLDLDHDRYRAGTWFCTEVARRGREETLSRMWEGPGMLPTLDELEDTVGWAARVLLTDDDFDDLSAE